MNMFQASHSFIAGLILGGVYVVTGSIQAPVLIHIAVNSFSVLLDNYADQHFFLNNGTAVFAAVAAAALLLVYYLIFRNRSCFYHQKQSIAEEESIDS